ncbi:MAG: D-2-hydroxyacid dehydrogenase family protein [Geminicoccaceae bacterium]
MKLAILDDYQRVALDMADWSLLRDAVEITVFERHLGGLDAVAAALHDFEIVCAMRERTPFPRALLERLPRLRLLVTTGAANAAIDLAAAAEHGVTVCGTASIPRPPAEHTWALILAAARHLPAEDRYMRAGGWQRTVGIDLAGRTLGVIGLGRIGGIVAEIGRAFGMTILAWSQNLTAERAQACGATLVAKEALLAGADFVTIHLRLGERTRGLIGAAELAAMRTSAWLVNTSRGPIVDEAALIDALERHAIAGAALDVYDQEPLPADHPLRRQGNTVLSPHLGYVTLGTYEAFYRGTVAAVRAWLDGTPIRLLSPS